MNYISEQIAEVASKHTISCALLSQAEADEVRIQIAKRYNLDPKYLLSYATCTAEYESNCDENVWRWISSFVQGTEVFLLISHADSFETWKIAVGEQIETLLGETTGFVFYLTDKDCTYLLYFDDHDCMLGLGKAVSWMRSLKKGEGENNR